MSFVQVLVICGVRSQLMWQILTGCAGDLASLSSQGLNRSGTSPWKHDRDLPAQLRPDKEVQTWWSELPIADSVPTHSCTDRYAPRTECHVLRYAVDAMPWSRQISTFACVRREQLQFGRRPWRRPRSRRCSLSSLAVEPCATLPDHVGETRLSAMPVVRHYSRHDRRAECP
jgi:hypothetical protein